MQGKSSDFAKHAIPSIRKQRILVTLTRYQPRISTLSDGHRHPSSAVSSHWSTPPSRSPSHLRHHVGPKHFPTAPTTGVLPAPPIRSQIPPNGIQPLFVPAPVAQAIPFPPPVALPPGSTGWPAAPPRHPPPRAALPGTGVFLPPSGSGNPASQQLPGATSEVNLNVETVSVPENNNAFAKHKHNSSTSPKAKPGCNGSIDGADSVQVAKYEQESLDKPKASNSD